MDSYTMKKYKFSLRDECMKELPTMDKTNVAYGYGRLYESDKKNYSEERKRHVKSLQSIPVPKEYLNQFEDGKVYDEDEFEIDFDYYREGTLAKGFVIPVNILKQKVEDTELWDEFFEFCYNELGMSGELTHESMIFNAKQHYTIIKNK